MAFHARLSPSAAHRWMNCAGSVALIGDESSTAGIEAMRGTAAHKIIEHMLQSNEHDASAYHNFMVLVHEPGKEETLIVAPGEPVTPADGWFMFVVDDKMVNGVQMMIDEHDRIVADECFDPVVYTERFLDMTWLDSRLGGTADDTIADIDWIHLLDYKNGRIVVEVKGNEQMKNYAVGLLHEHPDARGVTVHLVQPNAAHEDGYIRTESYTADELKLFEIRMKEAADATAVPNAPRRAGDWCTYCPAKGRCPEFDEAVKEEAGLDFASDPIETPPQIPALADFTTSDFVEDETAALTAYRAELARRAKWIPVLDQWARDLSQAIYNELMGGYDVPGKKLVHGKSNRAYVNDEATTAAELVEAGFPEDQLFLPPKMKSPAQVEKLRPGGMKAKQVKEIIAGLVFKPPGRISVADASDPRPSVDPTAAAAADFATDGEPEFGDA